jgi:hypothetical protein
MNFYSIEFFKHYLKLLKKEKYNRSIIKIIDIMSSYIKDREKNNESAYSKKWMKKPVFKD